MAVVWTIEKLRPYLLGLDFIVVADCNSLRTAFTKKHIVLRIGRWYLRLQEYRFNVEHRQGKSMGHVDALSRAPASEAEEMDVVDGVQNNNDNRRLVGRRTAYRSVHTKSEGGP